MTESSVRTALGTEERCAGDCKRDLNCVNVCLFTRIIIIIVGTNTHLGLGYKVTLLAINCNIYKEKNQKYIKLQDTCSER